MKPLRTRWRALVAATAAAAVVALSPAAALAASGSSYGSLPKASGSPKNGGTVKIAESPGAGPNYIFPITPANFGSVYNSYQFQNIMYRPLYFGPKGSVPTVDLKDSLAAAPKYSDGDKTVTISMKKSYTWSDGKPVDADDVIFFIDLLKAAVKEDPSNFGNYTAGFFPDNVTSATATDKYTVTLTLDKAYNPTFFYFNQLQVITPLPSTAWNRTAVGGPAVDYTDPTNAKAIYDFLAGQAKDLKSYATSPIWSDVDGAYKLSSYNASTNAATMVINRKYTGVAKPHITTLDFVAFTSETAQFNQLRSGALDFGAVPSGDLPQVPVVKRKGYNVYGLPDFGFSYIAYNFKDTTGSFSSIIGQLYIRQALAHLQNQPAVVKGVFKGAAGQAYGVVPAVPKSPFAPSNATKNPYPYSVATAKKLLTSHGWSVKPGGTTTCTSPGDGANQCGAGIAAGTPLTWNLYYNSGNATIGQQVTAFASAAKGAGITINTVGKTFNYIIENYSDPSSAATINDWAMEDFGGFTNSLYPTTNQLFNTGGSYNQGDYSDPKADQLINASVFGSNGNAVKTELQYITAQQPGLFQPNPALVFAWKKTLSGPQDSFASVTQYTLEPQYWYLTKK